MPNLPPKHRPPGSRTKAEADKARPNAYRRGYTHKWAKARAYWLARFPLCVDCEAEGRLVKATVVDHVVPHKGDPVLFWDESNWASRCKPHHDRKTALQDGRWG